MDDDTHSALEQEQARENAQRLKELGFGEGYGEAAPFAIVERASNYDMLYPGDAALRIGSFAPLRNSRGLVLRVVDNQGYPLPVEFCGGGSEKRRSEDGCITLDFEAPETAGALSGEPWELRLRPAAGGAWQRITLVFYSTEHYRKSGRIEHGHDRLHIRYTELEHAGAAVDDWILSEADAEEQAYARRQWSGCMETGANDYEKARSLAQALISEVEPHRGTPSDAMDNLRPFAMHRRLLAGQDKAWCANLAAIYARAGTALDLPVRCIIMRNQLLPPPAQGEKGLEVLLAGGHTVNEVFCEDTGQWVWFDLSLRVLGAYLGEEGPLNFWEAHHFLNAPARRPRMRFDVFDPAAGKSRRLSLDESGLEATLLNCLKKEQRILYLRRPWTASGNAAQTA